MRQRIVSVVLCLCSAAAMAAPSDRDQPLQITADRCVVDQKTQVSTCTGGVQVTQGSMQIRLDKLVTGQNSKGEQYAQGWGKPIRFQQKMENGDLLQAEAQRMDYESAGGVLRLMEKAWVRRNLDRVAGELIVYDTKAAQYQVDGGGQGGRVSITIMPRKPAADGAGQ